MIQLHALHLWTTNESSVHHPGELHLMKPFDLVIETMRKRHNTQFHYDYTPDSSNLNYLFIMRGTNKKHPQP